MNKIVLGDYQHIRTQTISQQIGYNGFLLDLHNEAGSVPEENPETN